jgi:sugar lactone lactonase YvrE
MRNTQREEASMMAEPKLLLDGLTFPEGPRFHDGRLYFSDQHAREVIAVDVQGRRETIVQVPGQPSGLGFLADGTLLIVSMKDRRLLRFAHGALSEVADLSSVATSHCNDMVVDAQGRAYIGNFGFDADHGAPFAKADLALVTPDGQVRRVASGLAFPNGSVITPDGRTLIVAETYAARLTAFDIAPDGSLSEGRSWAKLQVPPDGICLDAEGCIWISNPIAPGGFLRVAEGGEVRARIDLPDRGGIACMLGGPERRTLFMLEAFHFQEQRTQPGNGRIRVLEVEVPGAGRP